MRRFILKVLSKKVFIVYLIIFMIAGFNMILYNIHVPHEKRKEKGKDVLRRWITSNTSFQISKENEKANHSNASKQQLKTQTTGKYDDFANFSLQECMPSENLLHRASAIKTPFKIFIYDLPPKFNRDLIQCLQPMEMTGGCYSLENCGMGQNLFNITDKMFVMDTHMFSLDVVLHHKLLFSTYRTMDPLKADIFYIPVYAGLRCLCHKSDRTSSSVDDFVRDLLSFLNKQPFFVLGKPHFSSVGKIQREMQWTGCPYLPRLLRKNITFFSIEKETMASSVQSFLKVSDFVISAPYPSYIHYMNGKGLPSRRDLPELSDRNVFILLAAGRRRSNPNRARIMEQFSVRTSKEYSNYKLRLNSNSSHNMVFYYTDECRKGPRLGTIPWMMHSVFCLQPPGDSPTRKSFFDAILSGCIPVLFPYDDQDSAWPFMDFFQYNEFTVTIRLSKFLAKNENVLDILQKIPLSDIQTLHNNVRKVSQWFQYTVSNGNLEEPDDAMLYIFKELQKTYQLYDEVSERMFPKSKLKLSNSTLSNVEINK